MLTITKEFVFHAAHRLYLPSLSEEENLSLYGKCSKLHGHTYRLQVSVSGELNEYGMIIDFHDLKKIVTETIIDRYEHSFLNDLEEYQDRVPTVENMVGYIFAVLEDRLQKMQLTLAAVTVYETPTSWATLTS